MTHTVQEPRQVTNTVNEIGSDGKQFQRQVINTVMEPRQVTQTVFQPVQEMVTQSITVQKRILRAVRVRKGASEEEVRAALQIQFASASQVSLFYSVRLSHKAPCEEKITQTSEKICALWSPMPYSEFSKSFGPP